MATRQATSRRKPVYKEVEEREAKRIGSRLRASRTRRGQRVERRYAVVYDIDGPRVRLGIAWFLVASVAIVFGPLATALAYGATAAVAAAQAVRAWRRRRERPHRLVAPVMAGGIALGACLGAGGAGLAVLGGAGAALAVAARDTASRKPLLADAGWTIQCALPVGIAAMSMVLLTRLDQGSAFGLLLLVSAYETGDYLIGSGARNPYEGPVAGIAAITVATFIVSTFGISAFGIRETWVFGALVAVLAPLGQLLASAVLPASGSPASALRRLDSLLLAGPVWWLGIASVL
ncbi:MAG: hypothetical protein ACJ739_17520 [Acidimicrobiales bacterium]